MLGRADFGRAQTLGEHLLLLGQRAQDPLLQLPGHTAMGITRLFLGEVAPAHLHLAQSVSLYNLQQHQSLAFLYGMDCGMLGRALLGMQRLVHGYPNQGLQHGTEALRLAQEVTHPYTLASPSLSSVAGVLPGAGERRRLGQLEATGEALPRRLGEGAFDHRVDRRREIGTDVARARRRIFEVGEDRHELRLAGERDLAG